MTTPESTGHTRPKPPKNAGPTLSAAVPYYRPQGRDGPDQYFDHTGKKMQLLGYLEAVSEAAAIERAVVLYGLEGQKRTRLAVNLRGKA